MLSLKKHSELHRILNFSYMHPEVRYCKDLVDVDLILSFWPHLLMTSYIGGEVMKWTNLHVFLLALWEYAKNKSICCKKKWRTKISYLEIKPFLLTLHAIWGSRPLKSQKIEIYGVFLSLITIVAVWRYSDIIGTMQLLVRSLCLWR